MRFALICLALASCTPTPPAFREGAVVTENDPRDIDQCTVQPQLAWCVNACRADASREWCQ